MDSQSVNRALMSAGVWAGTVALIGLVTGNSIDFGNIGLDAGLMAVSALGSDLAHGWAGMPPSAVSSAVVTGVAYSVVQYAWRGDTSYVVNFGFASANDYAVDAVVSRLAQ